jgi:hypothetical protein
MSRILSACFILAAAFTGAAVQASENNSTALKEQSLSAPATLHYWQWKGNPGLAMLVAHRERVHKTNHVAGEKLDSGLGTLPHFEQWSSHPELAPIAARIERTLVGVTGR